MSVDSQVEKPVLLGRDESLLSLQFGTLGSRIRLGILGLGSKYGTEPIPDTFIFDPNPAEERKHLSFEIRLFDSNTRMSILVVLGAAVVNVIAWPALGLFDLPLPVIPQSFPGLSVSSCAAQQK